MQYLDEPGHVRAFEVVRQIHVHVEIRGGVLLAAGAVLHLDRVKDVLDAHLVDRYLTGVGMALHVLHGLHIRLLDGDGNVHNFTSPGATRRIYGVEATPSDRLAARARQKTKNWQLRPSWGRNGEFQEFWTIRANLADRPAWDSPPGYPTGC